MLTAGLANIQLTKQREMDFCQPSAEPLARRGSPLDKGGEAAIVAELRRCVVRHSGEGA